MAVKCLQCGSQRVVPNLPLNDHYGDVGGYAKQASLAVHGAPEAWFFKDSTEGKLTADVCGDCGHVMLRVSDFRALYEKYQQGGAGSSPCLESTTDPDPLLRPHRVSKPCLRAP